MQVSKEEAARILGMDIEIDPLWKRILYFVAFMVGFPLLVILTGALLGGLAWLFLIGWRLIF